MYKTVLIYVDVRILIDERGSKECFNFFTTPDFEFARRKTMIFV